MKRLLDLITAVFLLLLTFPLLLAVGLAIRLDSPGPIFYCQERVGFGGKAFIMFKFRSMIIGASDKGSYQTAPNDPRITRVGRFLRRNSLDELPQLMNVLLGDMSLVGPRPDVFDQRKFYKESDWVRRVSVRPGITGLAQATVRSSATPTQRLDLDLEYVENAGLLLDLKVLVLTARQVFGKGSY